MHRNPAPDSIQQEMKPTLDNRKPRNKWMHWLARIGTTFGLVGATWAYLYWLGLVGGLFLLGALCGLTAYEFLHSSPLRMPRYRIVLLAVISFFVPYLCHRMLIDPARSELTLLVFEIYLGIFILLTLLGLRYVFLLKVLSRSILFPIWGIALPMTSLIFTAHYVVGLGRTSTIALLWVITIIFVTKATDIGALLVGSWIGKHKLAPKTSPAKTIEGAIGGVVVSMLCALLIYLLGNIRLHSLGNPSPDWWNLTRILLASGTISIASILGDLYESSWKRHLSIKNSGSILPGLGGMYDLTDSLILASPVAYFLIQYFLLPS